MTGKTAGAVSVSYSEGLMDIATDLYARAHLERMAQMPGVRAKLLRQSELCRALAELVERAEELSAQEFQGQTSGAFPVRRETLLKLIEQVAAGFQTVVGRRGGAEPVEQNNPNDTETR